MLDQYRRDYVEFNTAVMRTEYQFLSGRQVSLELAPIYERFSDLFSRDAIEKLQQQLDETSPHFETDIASLRHLRRFAAEQFLESAAKELTEEISTQEAASTVEFAGRTMTFQDTAIVLATERERSTRQAVYNKRLNVIAAANDLRAERLAKLHEVARTLGYESYTRMFEQMRDLDYNAITRAAEPLLARTESLYVARLNEALRRDVGVGVEEAERSDYFYLIQLRGYDARFPASRLMEIYRRTMAGLGINIDAQHNIEIDSVERPHKASRAYCVPVVVPDEIKLMIRPTGGQSDYKALLHEAGHSQHYGWAVASLRPEFKYTGDYALTETYAFLFQHLLADRAWLAEFFGFADSAEFVRSVMFAELTVARRLIAKLGYEQRLHQGEDFARAANDYAESLTEATRFKTPKTEYLSDVDEGFYVANYVRAWAFESQLREHLKSRFGQRWWASPRVGNFLKEIWETGDRYTADEMASQIGIGPITFDLLIDEFNEALN